LPGMRVGTNEANHPQPVPLYGSRKGTKGKFEWVPKREQLPQVPKKQPDLKGVRLRCRDLRPQSNDPFRFGT